jgi:hypothetical protein
MCFAFFSKFFIIITILIISILRTVNFFPLNNFVKIFIQICQASCFKDIGFLKQIESIHQFVLKSAFQIINSHICDLIFFNWWALVVKLMYVRIYRWKSFVFLHHLCMVNWMVICFLLTLQIFFLWYSKWI